MRENTHFRSVIDIIEDSSGARAVLAQGASALSPIIVQGAGHSAGEVARWVIRYGEEFAPSPVFDLGRLGTPELEQLVMATQSNLNIAHYVSAHILRDNAESQCVEAAMRGLGFPYACALRELGEGRDHVEAEILFEEKIREYNWDIPQALAEAKAEIAQTPKLVDVAKAKQTIVGDDVLFSAYSREQLAHGERSEAEQCRAVLMAAGREVPLAGARTERLSADDKIQRAEIESIGEWVERQFNRTVPHRRLPEDAVLASLPKGANVRFARNLIALDNQFLETQKMPLAAWFAGLASCGVKKSDYVHLLEMMERYGSDAVIQGNRETCSLAAKAIITSGAKTQDQQVTIPTTRTRAPEPIDLLPTAQTPINRPKLRL